MNLAQECCQYKISAVAFHAIAQENAKKQGFELGATLKETCERAAVNRTQVYEKKNQIMTGLEGIELAGRGRPAIDVKEHTGRIEFKDTRIKILEYRIEHPGAVVIHASSKKTYSDGFRRLILDLCDQSSLPVEAFCLAAEVPHKTLQGWKQLDKIHPFPSSTARVVPAPVWPTTPNDTAATIAGDYQKWEGTTRDFLKHEAVKLGLPPGQIRRILVITGMLKPRSRKFRHRGSTVKPTPGTIIVTDGKQVTVNLTGSGEKRAFNWQGTVDQATTCHTAVVVTEEETAEGVLQAYEQSIEHIGRHPLALVHDNKPIHKDKKLRETVEKNTVMIPATPKRPENKAGIEGEFGKYEQQVSAINLDDTNTDTLIASAAFEVIRAYTAAADHAGRAEFDGKSRHEVLRQACPDLEKEKKLVEEIAARHRDRGPADPLPTQPVARKILDYGFEKYGLIQSDEHGKLRFWLSSRFQPDAIRAAFAIFGTKKAAGALKGKFQERYLVKLITSSQEEIDLRIQEDLLLEFAMAERKNWLVELDRVRRQLHQECNTDEEFAFAMAEHAVAGGIILERAYWEKHLKNHLQQRRQLITRVINHIRRIYEEPWNERFYLMNSLISLQHDLDLADKKPGPMRTP